MTSSETTHTSERQAAEAGLAKLLLEFQHQHWLYRERFGEMWPGIFDGQFAMPAQHLLSRCRLVSNRLDIIRALPKGGTLAEIGTLYGDFIVEVIKINEPKE